MKQLIPSEAHGFLMDVHIIRVFKLHKACPVLPAGYSQKKMWEELLWERKGLLLSRERTSHDCEEFIESHQFDMKLGTSKKKAPVRFFLARSVTDLAKKPESATVPLLNL